MSKSIEPVEDEITLDSDLIGKLIRMKRALHGWTNQELRDNYLNKAPYSFDIKNDSDISRFVTHSATSTLQSKEKVKLKKMVDEITLEIKLDLEGNAGFAGKPYKVNATTVDKWMKATEKSQRCIFFNTYIKMKDWHNPIIQMHMCLQKSIEQKSNLASIHSCHSKKGDAQHDKIEKTRIPEIHFCTNNPPTYKHYRILFLPIASQEYNESYENKDAFYDNLRFSTFQHSALSIQLAVMTVDDLIDFMSHNNYKDFFQKQRNLELLGLSKEFAGLIKKGEFNKSQADDLITCLTEMSDIPNKKSETGMDYMLIQRENDATTNEDIWTGVLTAKTGLNYVVCDDKESIKVRRDFTRMIFDYVTYDGMPKNQQTSFSNVDPLFDFNKDRIQRIVQNRFHPILRKH